MTRMKLLTISTITAVMILGSTLALAVTPESGTTTADTSADTVTVGTEFAAAPVKRGGGGTGRALKR